MLAAELKELDATLDRLTSQSARRLREQSGVGPQTAAILMAVAGENPERLRSEAALAALCGVSPLQASSRKTTRHRLNRGGDRSANNALWTIVELCMTACIGIAFYSDDAHDVTSLIACTDKALYTAKRAEKNNHAWPASNPGVTS